MRLDAVGKDMLIQLEGGMRLMPYRDCLGKWTVSAGVLMPLGPEGKPTLPTNRPITKVYAQLLFDTALSRFEVAVNRAVKVPLTQNQYNALVFFAYNIGAVKFATSTLVKLLNNRQFDKAANEFGRWVHGDHGEVIEGLVNRRNKEKALFLQVPKVHQQTNTTKGI